MVWWRHDSIREGKIWWNTERKKLRKIVDITIEKEFLRFENVKDSIREGKIWWNTKRKKLGRIVDITIEKEFLRFENVKMKNRYFNGGDDFLRFPESCFHSLIRLETRFTGRLYEIEWEIEIEIEKEKEKEKEIDYMR